MTRTRTLTAALALVLTVSLGGCTMTPPPQPGTQKTGLHLRDQLLDYIHDSLAASGLPDGWRYNKEPGSEAWDPATSEFIGSSCYVGSTDSQRLRVDLFHDPVGAAADFAATMSDYWTSRGYTVTVIVATKPAASGHHTVLRADLPNGAMLGVTAHDDFFILDFSTECSTSPTLDDFAGPHGYRTWDPTNPDDPYNAPTDTDTAPDTDTE